MLIIILDFDPQFALAEKMFTDIQASSDLTEGYNSKEYADKRLSVHILCKDKWPLRPRTEHLALPGPVRGHIISLANVSLNVSADGE